MQNLDSYFIEKGFFLEGGEMLLNMHCDNHMVRLKKSRKLPHLGILHYRDDVVFGKGSWDNFSRACRGVIVNFQNKKIIAKPFKKFFNLGESHAPSIRELEKRGNFVVTEKLDGSMGISFYDEVTDKFYVSTKGDIDSEQGAWATPLLPKSVQNKELQKKYTLMWEIISSKFQIVIPYDKKGYDEGLYLIGVRENISEKLFEPAEVIEFAKEYNLNTFKTYSFPTLQAIVDDSKTLPFTEEGYVIRFKGDETMVKVKSSEYLRVHRFISSLSDKNLLDVLIKGEEQNIYDNLGMVPEEYRDTVKETIDNYRKEAFQFRDECYKVFAGCPQHNDRKAFALHVTKNVSSEYKKFMFQLLDGKDLSLPQIYTLFKQR